MSVPLPLMLEERAVTGVPSDLLVAPFFESDRPLRGAAAHTDWRLCGMLSRRLVEGRIQGARGDAALVPTLGRMRPPRVLLIGLGPRLGTTESGLREIAAETTERILDLGARVPALALPSERSLPIEVSAQLRGWIGGVGDVLARRPAELALRLVAAPGEASALRAALVRLAARPPGDLEIRLAPDAAARPDPRDIGATSPPPGPGDPPA